MRTFGKNGRIYGSLNLGVFRKFVNSQRHMLLLPPAWAIDADVWDEIKDTTHEIRLMDKVTRITYRVDAETFNHYKWELDRGYGRQYALLLEYWKGERHEDKPEKTEVS